MFNTPACTQVRVWSRTRAHAVEFGRHCECHVCDSVEQAVWNADIICTLTFSIEPILEAAWVKQGAHINGKIWHSAPCRRGERFRVDVKGFQDQDKTVVRHSGLHFCNSYICKTAFLSWNGCRYRKKCPHSRTCVILGSWSRNLHTISCFPSNTGSIPSLTWNVNSLRWNNFKNTVCKFNVSKAFLSDMNVCSSVYLLAIRHPRWHHHDHAVTVDNDKSLHTHTCVRACACARAWRVSVEYFTTRLIMWLLFSIFSIK